MPSTNLWRCDPKIPLDVISCSDPLGNAVHTALSFDLVGEDVLITGAGPIGCMAVPIAKMAGARKVVITDVNPYRLDLARKMGATLAIDVRSATLSDTSAIDVNNYLPSYCAALQAIWACVAAVGYWCRPCRGPLTACL